MLKNQGIEVPTEVILLDINMKLKIYSLLKIIGFFSVSKFLFRDKLLILAYHGFEVYDESSFSGHLFMKKSTLEQRMEYLKRNNFNILTLSDALKYINGEKILPKNSIVITIDDGWYSTLKQADEVFSKFSFPYTIYVTSYYSKKEVPVLNVVLRYLLWSCSGVQLDTHSLNIPEFNGVYSLSDNEQKQELQEKMFTYFESLASTQAKVKFVEKISHLFGVDYKKIVAERYLSLLNLSEIKMLAEKGVDIQLHTHRHNLPFGEKNKFEDELLENKRYLMTCVKGNFEHFCYPSGRYDKSCEEILKNTGIISATTCEPGFVSCGNNCYYLPRFLDGENIPQITFEAEVTGVAEIFRYIRKFFKSIRFKPAKKTTGAVTS